MKKIVTGIIFLCIIFHCSLIEDEVEKKFEKKRDKELILCVLIASEITPSGDVDVALGLGAYCAAIYE